MKPSFRLIPIPVIYRIALVCCVGPLPGLFTVGNLDVFQKWRRPGGKKPRKKQKGTEGEVKLKRSRQDEHRGTQIDTDDARIGAAASGGPGMPSVALHCCRRLGLRSTATVR